MFKRFAIICFGIIGGTILSYGQIEKDKILHFVAGNISGGTGYVIGDYYNYKPTTTGISFSVVAGVFKESVDYARGGRFDEKDILATALGGVFITYTIKLIKKNKNEKINNNIVRSYRKHRKRTRKKTK